MRTVSILTLAALGAIAAPAYAQEMGPDTGPYIGLQAGLLIPEDVRVGDPATDWVVLDKGFDGGAFVGYDFGAFRLEAEFVAQHAKIDSERTADRNGIVAANELIGGDQRVLAGMANALVDFGSPESVNFYAGGGIGYAWYRTELGDADGIAPVNFPSVDETDGAFAWQLIAGVRYPLSRKADVGLKYRYFNPDRFEFDGGALGSDTARWRSHSVLATLSFNFGRDAAPPPPPPPPPPPVYQPAPPPPPPPPVYEPAPLPPPPPVRPGERG